MDTHAIGDAPRRGARIRGGMSDVIGGYVVGIIFYAVLIWFSQTYNGGRDTAVIIFSTAIGSAFGWVIGLVATPYNQDESRRLSEIAKVTYGFITGYLLSKIDPILTDLFSRAIHDSTERIVAITGVGVVGFLVTFGVTFISRSYWHSRA
jgi:hypothetical protein